MFGSGKKQFDFPVPGIILHNLAGIFDGFDRIQGKKPPLNRFMGLLGRCGYFAHLHNIDLHRAWQGFFFIGSPIAFRGSANRDLLHKTKFSAGRTGFSLAGGRQ